MFSRHNSAILDTKKIFILITDKHLIKINLIIKKVS